MSPSQAKPSRARSSCGSYGSSRKPRRGYDGGGGRARAAHDDQVWQAHAAPGARRESFGVARAGRPPAADVEKRRELASRFSSRSVSKRSSNQSAPARCSGCPAAICACPYMAQFVWHGEYNPIGMYNISISCMVHSVLFHRHTGRLYNGF